MEKFVNELALEQAKILERIVNNVKHEESFDENGYFPKNLEGSKTAADTKLESHVAALLDKVE